MSQFTTIHFKLGLEILDRKCLPIRSQVKEGRAIRNPNFLFLPPSRFPLSPQLFFSSRGWVMGGTESREGQERKISLGWEMDEDCKRYAWKVKICQVFWREGRMTIWPYDLSISCLHQSLCHPYHSLTCQSCSIIGQPQHSDFNPLSYQPILPPCLPFIAIPSLKLR